MVRHIYEPARLLDRFRWQTTATFPNRLGIRPPVDAGLVRYGLGLLARAVWKVGVRADYRREFWDVARPLAAQGRFEEFVHLAIVAHHLIRYSREAVAGVAEASSYADPARAAFGDGVGRAA
jgi:hypothetical protein